MLIAVAFVAVVALCASGLWRFANVRNSGARAMMRRLPAHGVHGWRHGVLRYDGERLLFYKLRSLSFSHDVALDRRGIRYEVRTMTEDDAARFKAQGHMQAPVVVTETDSWSGFRPDKIAELAESVAASVA